MVALDLDPHQKVHVQLTAGENHANYKISLACGLFRYLFLLVMFLIMFTG